MRRAPVNLAGDVAVLIGGLAVLVGVYAVYPPAAWILGGLATAAIGYLAATR